MPTMQQVENWRGRTLVDRDGDKIGKIEDIYLDRQTGEPEWIAVKTGTFGSNLSFLPIEGATLAGDDVRSAEAKDRVKDAPNVEADGELSPEEERRLYEYYGRSDYDAWSEDSEDRTATFGRDGDRDRDRGGDASGTVGRDTTGPTTDDAMTRSEEQLRVRTVVEPWTRAVLRIEEVTEEVMVPVTITRQQARIEYLPLALTDSARSTGDAAEPGAQRPTRATEWVTLYAEQPTVTLERVPVERVRLRTAWATEETTVSQELRREQIELDTTDTPDV
jgi:sporulation protein YlmC with PRC-barrel domain/stress response protein YsnF